MKSQRIRFDWKNNTVSYLWGDHPLVIAGNNKALDIVINMLEENNDVQTISLRLSKELNADIEKVSKYVETISNTLKRYTLLISEKSENILKNTEISHSLSMATLNITKKCNLNCIHCYADKNSKKEMTNDEIANVVLQLSNLITNEPKLLILSGGEPTLEVEKLKIAIKTARENGLNPRVNTNGYNIDDELAKFFFENNVLVQVSIDGIDAPTHALLRQSKKSYYTAINAVKCLVSNNCRTRISFTVHEKNYMQIPAMIDLAEELKVEQFITSNLVNVGNALENKLKGIEYSKEFDILYNCVKNDEKKQYMTRATLFAETITAIRMGIKFTYCGTGCSTCMVDSDGSLFPCINMTKCEYYVSNVLKTDFNYVWENSEILKRLRKLNIDSMNNDCKSCVYRYFCGGFCRGETIEAGQQINSKYIRCTEWKKALNKILSCIAESPNLYFFNNNISTGGFYRE
jgi:radical SAM protein with 4Fe4S-binding SPASM domain